MKQNLDPLQLIDMRLKQTLSLLLYLFGIICFIWGLQSVFHAFENMRDISKLPDFFSGLVLLVISAIIYAPIISEKISWAFHNFLFPSPRVEQKASLSIAQALVLQRDYEGALRELESKMEDFPDQKNLMTLYFQIKYEKCEQANEVLVKIREEVLHHPWDGEYEKMTMIAVDIYLENMDVDGSQLFLRQALELCDDDSAKTRMALRLHTFEDFDSEMKLSS